MNLPKVEKGRLATRTGQDEPEASHSEPGPGGAPGSRTAASRTADCVDLLAERLFYACYDWIVEGREPELDQGLVARRTRQRLAGMAGVFKAEIERRGLNRSQLNAWLGWTPGRLEQVLAQPWELMSEEMDQLLSALRLPVENLFENDKNQPKETST